jgi:hypothetical protein
LQVGVTLYSEDSPGGVTRWRGVIVHQHGAGQKAKHGATAASDLHRQALAKKWDCALLGPTYHVLNDAARHDAGRRAALVKSRHGLRQRVSQAFEELT